MSNFNGTSPNRASSTAAAGSRSKDGILTRYCHQSSSVLILLSGLKVQAKDIGCSISLPQNSNQSCVTQRQNSLTTARQFYELTEPTASSSIPFPQINKPFSQIYQAVMKDPINNRWFAQYAKMGGNNKKLTQDFLAKFMAQPYDAMDISEFKAIYDLWVKENTKNPYVKYPSQDYNTSFKDPYVHWEDDIFFAEQRLAGLNPMLLARVSPGWWDYSSVGCFKDRKKNRTFKRLYLNLRSKIDWTQSINVTIDGCALAARKLGFKYFSVQFWGECWGDDRLDVRARLGGKQHPQSKDCVGGVGKQLTNFVYEIKDSFAGAEWNQLKDRLNPVFDWDKAIENVLGKAVSLDRLIKDGHLFVLQYPLKDGIPKVPDILENTHPLRTMRDPSSPIALFVSKIGQTSSETRLLPLAIQLEHKQDSMVYTPGDEAMWEEAKLSVQSSDISHAQIIEHLLKSHLILEPMCVVMHRHFSKLHPLHQILQYHCRGVIMTNSYGFPVLMADDANMHRLFAIGNKGSMAMLIKGYHKLTWEDLDFEADIKRRGVDDMKALPYYPYRDDGKVIMDTLKKYVQEYVDLYYTEDTEVQQDTELQGFANELSDTGTGTLGGKGKFKRFPNKISTIAELVNVISRMIFISSVGHSVANYPVAVYGAMTFNMPTKLYDDPRTPPSETSVHTLPNIPTSVVNLAMGLGSLHYDSLLDYFSNLKDPNAAAVTKKYFGVLRNYVELILKGRNMKRFKEGRISYPFMLPTYLGNSIHT